MSSDVGAREEGFYWVILGQNPPEIAYWERGEWWLSSEPVSSMRAAIVGWASRVCVCLGEWVLRFSSDHLDSTGADDGAAAGTP